ncbi:DUF2087 domain-containing protein [Lentzea sp. NPDC051208]|uniref:DUF2087 domain-containing protein n=1 Tax=Lentzea sp. NPDC051208 TaxID=3154642 RepID=UPI00342AF7CF
MPARAGNQERSRKLHRRCKTRRKHRARRVEGVHPRTYYEEKEINERLAAWCDRGEVDHVTIRRYLVDFGSLERGGGLYQAQPLPM